MTAKTSGRLGRHSLPSTLPLLAPQQRACSSSWPHCSGVVVASLARFASSSCARGQKGGRRAVLLASPTCASSSAALFHRLKRLCRSTASCSPRVPRAFP